MDVIMAQVLVLVQGPQQQCIQYTMTSITSDDRKQHQGGTKCKDSIKGCELSLGSQAHGSWSVGLPLI
jgi:hypothetical protein